MADRSLVGKILAEFDRKIALLQAARAEVVAARPQRKPRAVKPAAEKKAG